MIRGSYPDLIDFVQAILCSYSTPDIHTCRSTVSHNSSPESSWWQFHHPTHLAELLLLLLPVVVASLERCSLDSWCSNSLWSQKLARQVGREGEGRGEGREHSHTVTINNRSP